MARRTECYVDTSALIAFLDRSDTYHGLFRRLFADPPPLAASALVAVEGHGWFLRRYGRRRAGDFLAFLRALPALRLLPFDAEALTAACELASSYPDQDLTLADAHGLAIMKSRRIQACWSTDRHLGLGGASLVR